MVSISDSIVSQYLFTINKIFEHLLKSTLKYFNENLQKLCPNMPIPAQKWWKSD